MFLVLDTSPFNLVNGVEMKKTGNKKSYMYI